ncbi:hypothetical protein FRB96_009621 [Tulasnella sp. 330]|nr:hypothetical protein FRB96_009621 [Tulasnella sp. 330]KAG8872148.1 hypothetical protein FRB97_007907 [Tulasnella sp. 331]
MIPKDQKSNPQRQPPLATDITAPAIGEDQDSQLPPPIPTAGGYLATSSPDQALPSGSSGDRGDWRQTGSSPPAQASPYRAGSEASINTDARQSGRGRSGSVRSSDGYPTEQRHENQSGEVPSSSSFEHLVVYPDIRRKKVEMACHFCRARKLKCDGEHPTCNHCSKRQQTCKYDGSVRRRGPGQKTKGKDVEPKRGGKVADRDRTRRRGSQYGQSPQLLGEDADAGGSRARGTRSQHVASPTDDDADRRSLESEGHDDTSTIPDSRSHEVIPSYGSTSIDTPELIHSESRTHAPMHIQFPQSDVKPDENVGAEELLLNSATSYSSYNTYAHTDTAGGTGAITGAIYGYQQPHMSSPSYPLRPVGGGWTTSSSAYNMTPSSLAGAMTDPTTMEGDRSRTAWRVDHAQQQQAPQQQQSSYQQYESRPADQHAAELYGLAYGSENPPHSAIGAYLDADPQRAPSVSEAEVLRHEYAASQPGRYAAQSRGAELQSQMGNVQYGVAAGSTSAPPMVADTFPPPSYPESRTVYHSPTSPLQQQHSAAIIQGYSGSNEAFQHARGNPAVPSPVTPLTSSSTVGASSRPWEALSPLLQTNQSGPPSAGATDSALAESLMELAYGPERSGPSRPD